MKKSRLSGLCARLDPTETKQKRGKRREKSNITADRVTLLPGFLSGGVKSETARRAPSSREKYEDILSENLHGLLQQGSPQRPRRSNRLSKKAQAPSDYYLQVIVRECSKSIFKEIKEKYAQKLKSCDFGARFAAQFRPDFDVEASRFYREKILEEATAIDRVLTGRSREMPQNRKRNYSEEDKENFFKFPCVPQSSWVFQTPPNRKLSYSHHRVEDNGIKPAVLEKCNEAKKVYEVNEKINVDFTRYSNHQEIEIDKRYLVESADSGNDITVQLREPNTETKFQFNSESYELENHFLSLTCRPKKAMTSLSRVDALKRKRDIFEPEAGCSSDLETATEFNSSFDFLTNGEESFTFKFTVNEGSSGTTTGLLFDFEGNKKDSFNFHY